MQGPWKESAEQTIRWTEWNIASVEKFIEWLYTDDYSCPYPTLIEVPAEGDSTQPKASEQLSSSFAATTETNNAQSKAGASEERPAKKQKLLPLKELSWNGKPRPTRLTQAEEFEKWSGHQLWISEELDYGATFSTHAEIYVMGRHYMLDELSNMAWDRLRAVLKTIDRPIAGSGVITNVMDLILDTYDKISNPNGDEEPLRELISTFVALQFTAFQGSAMEDWVNSDNSTARDFIADLMGKLMLRVKELEEGTSTSSVVAIPPSTNGAEGVGFSNSNHPNPMNGTRPPRGKRPRW